jgi:hypothetical protein
VYEDTRRRLANFIESEKLKSQIESQVGMIKDIDYDFHDDLVTVSGSSGTLHFQLSLLLQLAQISTVH